MSNTSRMDRRTFFTVSGIGLAAAAVGARAVMAQDSSSTPTAGSATPGATPGASPTASGVIEVHTLDTLKFDPSELTVSPGQEIHVVNKGNLQHDFIVDELDMATDLLDSGDEQTVTVPDDAEPAEYTYYCSVPGHRQAGMEGKLTVK
jgi:nitrite reductase (NO-forming)